MFGYSDYSESSLLSSMFTAPESRDDRYETDSISQMSATTQSVTLQSCLSVKSKNFMFPKDKALAIKEAKQSKGYVRRAKHANLKVSFADLAHFMLYDADSSPVGKKVDRWLWYSDVYLLTGQQFVSFEEDFAHLTDRIFADSSNARTYWRKIMLKGCPIIRAKENIEGMLNHVSYIHGEKPGVLPLLGDVNINDLVDPDPTETEMYRTSSARSFESLASVQMGKYMAEYFDDMPDKDADEGNTTPQDFKPDNVYKRIEMFDEDNKDNLLQEKARADYKGLIEYIDAFGKKWRKLITEDHGLKDVGYKSQEMMEIERFQEMSFKLKDHPNISKLLGSPVFQKFFARFLSIRRRNLAFNDQNLKKTLRKLFASPLLDVNSTLYGSFASRAIAQLMKVFKMLSTDLDLFKEIDELLLTQNSKVFNVGATVESLKAARGLVIAYTIGSEHCVDVMTGEYYQLDTPKDVRHSTLVPVTREELLIRRKNPNKPVEPVKPDVERLPPALIVVPSYFQHVSSFLQFPMVQWMHWKQTFAESFVSLMNSATCIAILNNNRDLLKALEGVEYPETVVETSLLAMEPNYCLETKGNNAQYAVSRKMLDIRRIAPLTKVSRNHWNFDYLSKEGNESAKGNTLYSDKERAVKVGYLSVAINPALRADLQYSKPKKSCETSCLGHKGMLMATVIRLGQVDMVDYLSSNGLRIEDSCCGGDAVSTRWDLEDKGKSAKKSERTKKSSKKQGPNKEEPPTPPKEKVAKSLVLADELDIKKHKVSKVKDAGPKSSTPGNQSSNSMVDETKKQKKTKPRASPKPAHITTEPGELCAWNKRFDPVDSRSCYVPLKTRLRSSFKRVTPISVAIDCAVSDIYAKRVSHESPRKSKKDIEIKEHEATESLTDIEGRVDLVERFVASNCNMLGSDMAAIRACLPVVEQLARSAKKKTVVELRKQQLIAKNASIENNKSLSKTPRRPSKVKRLKEKFAELAEFSKRKLSSATPIAFATSEIEAFNVYSKGSKRPHTEKIVKYTAACSALKVLNLVCNATMKQLNTLDVNQARKFGGNYASVAVRFTLIHEAIIRQKWDVVRFLAPYKINHILSNRLRLDFPSADVYDTTWKDIDFLSAKALHKAAELLIMDMNTIGITTAAFSLQGVYFIMKEYNVILSNDLMRSLLDAISNVWTSSLSLQPRERDAIAQLFTLKQVQHYLGVARLWQFNGSRCLSKLGKCGRSGSKLKKKRAFDYLSYFCVLAGSESMISMFDLLYPIVKERYPLVYKNANTQGIFGDIAFTSFILKERYEDLDGFLALLKEYSVPNSEIYPVLQYAARAKMFRPSFTTASVCWFINRLYMLPNFRLQPVDIGGYIARLLKGPRHQLDEGHVGLEYVAVDLSRPTLLYNLANDLFFFHLRSQRHNLLITFQDICNEIWASASKGLEPWHLGISLMFVIANAAYPEISTLFKKSAFDTAAKRLYQILNQLTLSLQRDENGKFRVVPVRNTDEIGREMDELLGDGYEEGSPDSPSFV